jgi:hypothetical protein
VRTGMVVDAVGFFMKVTGEGAAAVMTRLAA